MKVIITKTFFSDFKIVISYKYGLSLFLKKIYKSKMIKLDKSILKFKFDIINNTGIMHKMCC